MIIVLFALLIKAVSIEPMETKEDYCDTLYGRSSYYNAQVEKPRQVGSCDFIEEDGTITEKYFTDDEFEEWRDR
jgi:hypothetical protein